MTGLDPARHRILEIAVLVTDDHLNLIAEGPDLVVFQPPEVLAEMDEKVQAMHDSSGLLKLVAESTLDLAAAGHQTQSFLNEHIAEPGTVPLCGNSIGADRRFLARYLPEIENFLHYRSIDVSTVKELARRWRPQAYEQAPEKKKNHRALDDIYESLEELRWYRREFFRTGGPVAGHPSAESPQ